VSQQPTEILLVEDEVAHIRLIQRAFSSRSRNFHVNVARTLEEARSVLARSLPEVAIVDWLLPDGNGIELLAEMKEEPEFPIVVMTSHGSEEVAVEAMKAGVIDYVVKQEATLRGIPLVVERALREWGHVMERRRAEEELELYRDQLEELVEKRTRELVESRERLRHAERLAAVGTLAAGIAHEINNPIAAILAAAQLALISEGDSESQGSWRIALRDIEREAMRCGKIVKSVLQFSRNQPTEKWIQDLQEVVRSARDAASRYAHQNGVMVQAEMDESPLPVLMNPIEMEQVLLNLIRNAIESCPAEHTVIVHCRRGSDSAYVEVRDRGKGIGPDDLRRIFDPFFTTRLLQGGIGLGLSVAHGIVVDHGGSLDVESRPGEGTTMRLCLPLSDHSGTTRDAGR
jgi:signal transduction histidine kinase